MNFLMGLNESFASVRGQILLIKHLPSLTNVLSLITQKEKQRMIGFNSFVTESAALFFKGSNSYGKNANTNANRSSGKKERQVLPNITSIDSLTHLCLTSSISLDHFVFSFNIFPPSNLKSTEWIIDSGATDHMIHSISLLTKITSVAHVFANLPNVESVLVTHVG